MSVAVEPRVSSRARETFERTVEAHNTVLAGRHAFNPRYGRRLPRDLADAGLADVACEGRAEIWPGGYAGATVWPLTFMQLREATLASGLATPPEIQRRSPCVTTRALVSLAAHHDRLGTSLDSRLITAAQRRGELHPRALRSRPDSPTARPWLFSS